MVDNKNMIQQYVSETAAELATDPPINVLAALVFFIIVIGTIMWVTIKILS